MLYSFGVTKNYANEREKRQLSAGGLKRNTQKQDTISIALRNDI